MVVNGAVHNQRGQRTLRFIGDGNDRVGAVVLRNGLDVLPGRRGRVESEGAHGPFLWFSNEILSNVRVYSMPRLLLLISAWIGRRRSGAINTVSIVHRLSSRSYGQTSATVGAELAALLSPEAMMDR